MNDAFDVVVAGAGPAGIGAAIAAGRMGAKTCLLERHDVLGGMGTAGLVNNFCPAHLDGRRMIIGGVFAELRGRLIERKAMYPSRNFGYAVEPFDPEVMNEEAAALCKAAGVTVLTGFKVSGAVLRGSRVELKAADGRRVSGAVLVDASGNYDAAAALGTPFSLGRETVGAVMPLTYCYMIGPVDLEAVRRARPHYLQRDELTGEEYMTMGAWQEELKADVLAAKARGEVSIPRNNIALALGVPRKPGYVTVNFGRVAVKDPTDAAQMEAAEAEGRRQVSEGVAFFKKYVPGFERAELVALARQIGVRESRQLHGRYTLRGEDVLGCKQFEDVICQCCYAVDVHEPHKETTRLVELPRGQHFDIPWRCLVPESGPENVLVAGRGISATQEAMSSFRVAPSVMGIGEAAGVGAALAARTGRAVGAVPVAQIQARLRETGGILE